MKAVIGKTPQRIASRKIGEKICQNKIANSGAAVVAQLVEWSLPIPEVRGSNPVIGKNVY